MTAQRTEMVSQWHQRLHHPGTANTLWPHEVGHCPSPGGTQGPLHHVGPTVSLRISSLVLGHSQAEVDILSADIIMEVIPAETETFLCPEEILFVARNTSLDEVKVSL